CASRRCGIDNDLRCHISSVIVRALLLVHLTSMRGVRANEARGRPTRQYAALPHCPPYASTPPAPATPSCLLSYKATLWSPLQGQAQNTAPLEGLICSFDEHPMPSTIPSTTSSGRLSTGETCCKAGCNDGYRSSYRMGSRAYCQTGEGRETANSGSTVSGNISTHNHGGLRTGEA